MLASGSSRGRVYMGLTGGWYAAADQLESVMRPLLQRLPKPGSKKLTVGSYIDSVEYLGGLGTLNTTGSPDSTDTFYAKSLMTPQANPMGERARTAFMNYLATDKYSTSTVSNPIF